MTNSLTTVSVSKSVPITIKKNRYKHFNLAFLGTIIFSMLGLGLFNYVIDPYGVFNAFYLSKFNDEKPKKDNNDRLFKAIAVTQIKPTTVIIGSSRTKQGINPDHPIFKNQQPAYNLAINGPNVYEVKRYLEHAIANQKNINTVIFGVDFFMFNGFLENQPSFKENRLEKKSLIAQDAINILFSLDAINSSWETINVSRKKDGDPSYGLNGFMPNRNAEDGKNEWRFQSSIRTYYDFHFDYELSLENLRYFQDIVNLCKENNIDLKIFISPAHATQWESISATGEWQTFEQWKRELVKIAPIWDFSGYNNITTEQIKDIMDNYVDSSHYRENIGNVILNRIYNQNNDQIPDYFGVLITEDNIEQHLANIRQQRQLWQQNNPEETQLVTDIYQEEKEKRKQKNQGK